MVHMLHAAARCLADGWLSVAADAQVSGVILLAEMREKQEVLT